MDYPKLFAEAKEALQKLHGEKANIENQLESLNGQIEAMTATVNAIAPLVGERPIPTLKDTLINAGIDVLRAAGISVAVRAVMDAQPDKTFTAPTIRDLLQNQGWDWAGYANPLSTIHTVLKRLTETEPPAAKAFTHGQNKVYKSTRTTMLVMEPPIGIRR